MATINPTEINVAFKELKKVIHVSDIHIRLFKRHREYREVFEALYSQIGDSEDFVILVSGDILHAKTDLSPEMIALASEFLKRLADIGPTLVTVGNHDMNLANTYRLDSLSPIIENISNPNLYYLKDSGVCTVADTDFAIYSIVGDRKDWPKPKHCRSPNKVALLHAPVNDAKTDTGFTISSRHVDVSTFNGYHMVMLGDIHKHQILQDYNGPSKQPLISYAGSLIQQNHGENLDGHGYLEWDIPTRTLEHHTVPNKYGYATLIIEDGKVPDLSHIPENARLRVFVKDLETSKVKKIESILRKKFNLQEFIVNKMRDDQLTLNNRKLTSTLIDVQDSETQNKLIEDYLTRHFAVVDKELMGRIHELNDDLNGRISAEDLSRNVRWKPLVFEFSNMFSYGEGNVIDFDSMNGVHGLFSPNASGKTAAFDALMFCLYDKTPRAYKASHIMNNRKNKFECYLRFEINGEEYGIKRIGKRKKNRDVKVDVEFWKFENGQKIPLNAEDRRTTNSVIRRYVGTYDDFILTSLSVQNNSALFIDKSQSERKDLLGQFMGINVFDTLYQLAMDEMKETRGALKRMGKEDYAQSLVDSQTLIDDLQSEFDALEIEQQVAGFGVAATEEKITRLYQSRIPLDTGALDIGKLEETKSTLADSLFELSKKSLALGEQKKELTAVSGSQVEILEKLNGVVGRYETAQENQHQLQLVDSEIKILTSQISRSQLQLDHITTHKFDPTCDFCVENNSTLVSQTSQLRDDLTLNQLRVEDLEPQIVGYHAALFDYDEIVADFDSFGSATSKVRLAHEGILATVASMGGLKAKVSDQKSRLKDVNTKIKSYHRSVDAIEKNAEIDEKIEEFEQHHNELSNDLRGLNTKIRGVHGKLQVQKSTKRKILEAITEMGDLEQTIQAYEFYVQAVKRDGVPYELISKVIPSIESEVNNILSQITDFTVSLEVDGKNINGRMQYGDDRHWPLEMSSGMERFISSLAIRVALITVSNLPKPNFLIIDEGLGTLSSENLMSMHQLFAILKNQFDFIIIISHLEAVRDMVDSLMEIQLDNGFSKINY